MSRLALPPRAHVRDLFLRLLGVVHLTAFVSLWLQIPVLMGSRGLLPASEWLGRVPFRYAPSVFHLGASDAALHAGAAAGTLASGALILGLAPRLVLPVLWALYLSFTVAGSRFYEFQWDTLLVETTFLAWFVAPWGWRPRGAAGPKAVPVLLLLGLVFELHVESGLAKLVSGDETWRDLTAMVSYYETAPLPTRLAWWAHQLPVPVHRAMALLVLVVEIGLPVLVIAPHRVRGALFLVFASLQLGTILTANYAFFNWLTIVLCLFVLDDGHLAWLGARLGKTFPPRAAPPRTRPWEVLAGALLAVLSVAPFIDFCGREAPLHDASEAVLEYTEPFRTLNAYHLFASMTLERREVVIEGSLDGESWEEYELRYKPGDPLRAPRFVAPYQPRVDFLLWFARLGGADLRYLGRLVGRLLDDPGSVSSLFARMPFEGRAPRFVRIKTYQYHFTDWTTGRETGAFWERVDLPRETSEIMSREH